MFPSDREISIKFSLKVKDHYLYCRENLLELVIYFESFGVLKVEQKPEYSPEDILGASCFRFVNLKEF